MSKKTNWKKLRERIPSRIQTAARRTFEISWIDRFPDPTIQGETRFPPNFAYSIVLKTGEPVKETVHTYFHEVLHAISDTYDVGLTESQVQKLEKALYYVLKQGNLLKEEL